jgi:gamma-glutamylcyclotransferase (GGCT)/AIG2-like uncharacterized protein YtfP
MTTAEKDTITLVHIFVYGTLRAATNHDISKVLARHADLVGRGRIAGVLYDVGPYPGAVKKAGTRAFVWGDVYRPRDPERALQILDRYEGWDEKKQPRSAEFKRSRVAVDVGAGKKVRAWIYLYNRPTKGLAQIRSGDYLKSAGTRTRAKAAKIGTRDG